MKRSTSLTIDVRLLEIAQDRKINLSDLFNSYLKTYLLTDDLTEDIKLEELEALVSETEHRYKALRTELINKTKEKQKQKDITLKAEQERILR